MRLFIAAERGCREYVCDPRISGMEGRYCVDGENWLYGRIISPSILHGRQGLFRFNDRMWSLKILPLPYDSFLPGRTLC